MPHENIQNAIWTPGWYELDQSLVVGDREKFWFFQTPPHSILLPDDESQLGELVFFNQLDSDRNCVVRYARIEEIYHPQLGALVQIDTDGLDYIFFSADGREYVVNAEEDPGIAYDSDVDVKDWSVAVKLSDVSEPMAHLV